MLRLIFEFVVFSITIFFILLALQTPPAPFLEIFYVSITGGTLLALFFHYCVRSK